MNFSFISALFEKWGVWLLLAGVGAFGVWAISADQQPTFTDSVLTDATLLHAALTGQNGMNPARYLEATGYRPPLAYAPAGLLFLLTGPSLLVLRLTVLVQYLIAVWLTHNLGSTVANRRAGLFAAVLVATFPMLFGWGRMAYVDLGLALMVLVCLRLLVTTDLDRPGHGVRLGLAVGAGLLTKVAFPVFALAPFVWLLAARLRKPRQLAVLGLAAGTAVLVAGVWYLPQWSAVLTNLRMSSGSDGSNVSSWGVALASYTLDLDGVVWLAMILLAAAAHAEVHRTVDRSVNLLFLMTIFGSFFVLLQFHASRRYALPIYLVAAAWAGICAQMALDRPGRRRPARLGLALLSLVLLGNFVSLNLGQRVYVPPGTARAVAGDRVDGLGMLAPDRRDHDQLRRALDAAARRHRGCMVAFNGVVADELMGAQLQRVELKRRTKRPRLFWHWPRYMERGFPSICVLLVQNRGGANQWYSHPPNERGFYLRCRAYDRFLRSRPRARLARFGPSALGLTYSLFELQRRHLARPGKEPDFCRADRVFWDQ